MVRINFPCGCQVNETAVLGMCLEHATEIRQKQIERDREYAEYVRRMRGASEGKSEVQK
jgi:hypothetical protein